MSTTFPWDGQGLKNPTSTTLALRTFDAGKPSPFTAAYQTILRAPPWWEMTWTWQGLAGDERAELLGFFSASLGRVNRFLLPFFEQCRGQWINGPVTVKGASQTGTALVAENASGGVVVDQAKRNDFFELGSNVYRLTQDADAAADNELVLNFTPPLRRAPTNGATITPCSSSTFASDQVAGLFILMSDIEHENRPSAEPDQVVTDQLQLVFMEDVLAGS